MNKSSFDECDDLYGEVKKNFAGCAYVPLSLIQIRFGIGMKKAALIKERLHADGVLSEMSECSPEEKEATEKRLAEVAVDAIKLRPHLLEFIDNQTEEMCMAAVRQDGLVLEFVQNQTPEICAEAIRNNSAAVRFVRGLEEQ